MVLGNAVSSQHDPGDFVTENLSECMKMGRSEDRSRIVKLLEFAFVFGKILNEGYSVIQYSSLTVYSSRTRVHIFRTRTRTRALRTYTRTRRTLDIMMMSHITSCIETVCRAVPIRFNFVARAKFELAQPIRCRRAYLLLIRYVTLVGYIY